MEVRVKGSLQLSDPLYHNSYPIHQCARDWAEGVPPPEKGAYTPHCGPQHRCCGHVFLRGRFRWRETCFERGALHRGWYPGCQGVIEWRDIIRSGVMRSVAPAYRIRVVVTCPSNSRSRRFSEQVSEKGSRGQDYWAPVQQDVTRWWEISDYGIVRVIPVQNKLCFIASPLAQLRSCRPAGRTSIRQAE